MPDWRRNLIPLLLLMKYMNTLYLNLTGIFILPHCRVWLSAHFAAAPYLRRIRLRAGGLGMSSLHHISSTTPILSQVDEVLVQQIIMGVIALLVTLAAAGFFAKSLTAPILQLVSVMGKHQKGI